MQREYGPRWLRLRSAPTPPYRRFTLIWRSIIIILSAIALGFEVSIVASIFDPRFPAREEFMSTLPTGGLCGHIIWSIVAIATAAKVKPFMHTIGDLFSLISLIVMGYVGFNYDDVHYLRNGVWRSYETPNFLSMEIAAGVLMIIVAILQGVLIFATALTCARVAPQPDVYHYGIQEPAQEEEAAYYKRDDERASLSKSSLNSVAKVKFDKQ